MRDWGVLELALEIGDGEDLGIRTGVDIFQCREMAGVDGWS